VAPAEAAPADSAPEGSEEEAVRRAGDAGEEGEGAPGGEYGEGEFDDVVEGPSIFAIFRRRIRPALEMLDDSREQMAEASAGWPRALGFLNINAKLLRTDHSSYVNSESDYVIEGMLDDPEVHDTLRELGHRIPRSGSPEATYYTRHIFGRDGMFRRLRQIAYNIDSAEQAPIGAFVGSRNKNNAKNAYRNLGGRPTTRPGNPNSERPRNLPLGRGDYGPDVRGT
jgi:hypothetical protein